MSADHARGAETPIRRVGVDGDTEEYAPSGLGIDQTDRALVDEPVEWLVVFWPDERQVARFRGTPDRVVVSDELARRRGPCGLYGDPMLKDRVVVHNHPSDDDLASFPPSPADLVFAVAHDLSRLIVVSGRVRYELRRRGRWWPFDEQEISELIAELVARVGHSAISSTRAELAARNLRVFTLMHKQGLMHFERSTIADDDR